MRNIRKSILIFLVAVTVAYTLIVAYRGWCYHQRLLSMPTSHPQLGRIIYDFPKSFFGTQEGILWLLGLIPLAGLWFLARYKFELKSTGTLLIPIVCLLVSTALMPFPAYGIRNSQQVTSYDYSFVVDVLCAGDEEFMENTGNIDEAEEMIAKANSWTSLNDPGCFELTFGLHFEVRGWVSWDSDDNTHDEKEMALELWVETGFDEGSEYGDVIIDMLCAFTGQDIDGYYAVAFPDANITMIEWDFITIPCFYTDFGVIRHEFSHQYWTPECTHACVMNQGCLKETCDPTLPPGCWDMDWCSDCEAWINEYKDKWPNDVTVTVETSSGGTTTPSPGSYPVRTGTTFTVEAYPYTDYTFAYWVIDGSQQEGNPSLNLLIDQNHTVEAHFKEKSSGAGGIHMLRLAW